MKKQYCVYCHISPSGKRYIGITSKKPEKRWNYGFGYYGNSHFTRAIKKYGWDAFQHIILCDGLTMKEASAMEIEFIRKYDTTNHDKGYNVSPGGMNEDQVYSVEIGGKISDAKRGKPCPEWQKRHLSKLNKGKMPTNIDDIHKRNQKRVNQYDIDGNYIATYPSIRIAGRECNVSENGIGLCCRGHYKKAGGYVWRFADC
jgi:hypothetical protein